MLARSIAGYSGKPLTQKLGIQPGFCIFVGVAPAAYGDIVGKLRVTVQWPNCVRRSTGVLATGAAGLAGLLGGYVPRSRRLGDARHRTTMFGGAGLA